MKQAGKLRKPAAKGDEEAKKELDRLMKEAGPLKEDSKAVSKEAAEAKALVLALETKRDKILTRIGNIVHESVPISNDEEKDSEVVNTWPADRDDPRWSCKARVEDGGNQFLHHHQALQRIDGFDQ